MCVGEGRDERWLGYEARGGDVQYAGKGVAPMCGQYGDPCNVDALGWGGGKLRWVRVSVITEPACASHTAGRSHRRT